MTFKVQILQWDDFSWGSFVKHLNHYGTYWLSDAAILEQGVRYFPGLSLWENFFIGRDYYFEQPLFFALGLIFITVFHAMVPTDLRSKKYVYYFVLFCAPISWFTIGLGTISTETTMGLLLGIGLTACLKLKKTTDLVVPFTIALFLAITKETAFLLALLIVFLIVIRIIREKRFLSKWLLFCFVCLLLMIMNFQLWQHHLKTDPLLHTFDMKYITGQFQQDLESLSPRTRETIVSFFQALYNRPIGRSFLSRIPVPLFQYVKGFYIFWVALFTVVVFYAKEKVEYLITFFWGLLGYTFVIVVTFLYFFGEYEGRILASYERYMGVYFLAFYLLLLEIIFEKKLYGNKTFLRCLVGLIIVFPPSPRILYPPSLKYLVSEKIINRLSIKVDKNIRLEVSPISSKILALTPPNSKIWLIWQNTVGYEAMILRYEIAPRKMNVGGWSVGDKYYEGDVWTANYSVKELSGIFQKIDFTALGYVDDKFTQKYGELFMTPPKSGALYKKEIINNSLRLVEI